MGVDVAGDDTAEVVQPSNGAFDLPPLSVTPQLPTVLRRLADPALAVRADQFNPVLGEPLMQRVAIGRSVVDPSPVSWPKRSARITVILHLEDRHFDQGVAQKVATPSTCVASYPRSSLALIHQD